MLISMQKNIHEIDTLRISGTSEQIKASLLHKKYHLVRIILVLFTTAIGVLRKMYFYLVKAVLKLLDSGNPVSTYS